MNQFLFEPFAATTNYSFLKRTFMRKLFLLMPLLLLTMFALAQQRRITGVVTSKMDKTPLAGVTIQTKSKTVLTDTSGRFSIEAPVGENLTFSYAGMKPVTFKVKGSEQSLMVEMEEGAKEGDEIVVVGYTSQRKKDLLGAVSVVNIKETTKESNANI